MASKPMYSVSSQPPTGSTSPASGSSLSVLILVRFFPLARDASCGEEIERVAGVKVVTEFVPVLLVHIPRLDPLTHKWYLHVVLLWTFELIEKS